MKKNYKNVILQPFFCVNLRISMVVIFIMLIVSTLHASSQDGKVQINIKNGSFATLVEQISKQTKYTILFKNEDVKNINDLNINKSASVKQILTEVLANTNLQFNYEGNSIVISRKDAPQIVKGEKNSTKVTVSGKVLSGDTREPIVGATVLVIGTTSGAITNEEGLFTLTGAKGDKLEITFVGMIPVEYTMDKDNAHLVITMKEDAMAVEDVVVTGIYSRKKESFTGSATTYTKKELKMVGSTNLLQSLKTLDPTFVMLDSKKFGSDPNRLPDMEIRGATSISGLKSEFGEDPNRPLFILDGVESSLDAIVNLNMDRVESITVLKDAASTAIYGSKAANGVIVVETIQPKPGKLRLSYSGNFVLTTPDLTDYNLMNAAEKLEFERLAGEYGDNENLDADYYGKLTEVLRGVDTYWLSQPLRTVLNNTHNIYVDGGEGAMRYGIGVNYNGNNGVMKGSSKDVVGANLQLSYRTSKLVFSNQFNVNVSTSKREPVPYSSYSKQNPYSRLRDDEGNYMKYTYIGEWAKELNPCYVAQFLNENKENRTTFSNTFSINWTILNELKIDGNFNINHSAAKNEQFISPNHPNYDDGEQLKKGSFDYNANNGLRYSGRATITYGKLFNQMHQVNLVVGGDFSSDETNYTGYSVKGFVSDLHQNPQYSAGFTEGQVPTYSINKSRSANFYANANYSFKNRYLVDANMRLDGTSRFGSNKMFSKTWAFGLAWNIHNEKFIRESVGSWLNNFKIRASVGNPGNQNFDAYLAYKTYTYNSNYQNMFGTSALINSFGNKNLEWQKTLDKNIGIDLSILNNKVDLYIDYYNKKTDPLLIDVGVPISTGTSSLKTNLGGQVSTGASGRLGLTLLRRNDFSWNANYTFRIGKSKYFGIGETLNKLNQDALSSLDPSNEKAILGALYDTDALKRYYDGGDPNDLYAVRSLGIDPATGQEVFLDGDGVATFEYINNAQVKVGNSRPDIAGVVGTNLNYKNFTFNVSIGYSFGAQQMASALYQKVENITSSTLRNNQDKRALYERWQKPGDIAKYSSIESIGYTIPKSMSSRFIVTEDYVSLESVSVGYDFTGKWLKMVGLTGANVNVYLNNIARISSFKEERGIDYPFARTITFALGLRF